MSLTLAEVRRGLIAAAEVPQAPPRTRRVADAVLPLVLILLWTAAVRLPFCFQTDKDEFFFSVIAGEWARGGLPYVATFDLKPPGIFFLYLVVQAAFGASQMVIKLMEIAAVGLAGWCLYLTVRRAVSTQAAAWAAIMLPVYMLATGGAVAVNMLLQLPFTVAAFSAVMAATDEDRTRGTRLIFAFLSGLAIGYAGMIKQTAIFEAAAFFLVLLIYSQRGDRLASAALYALGAAIPAAAFIAYFASAGAFDEMFRAVITLSLGRTAGDVASSYGPDYAFYFTPLGILLNAIMTAGPLVFLGGAASFLVLRRARIFEATKPRIAVVCGIWLVAAFAGVAFGRVLSSYYILALVPPLVILAAIFFCHGLELAGRQKQIAFVLSLVAGAGVLAVIERENFFMPNAFLAGDYDATRRVSAAILAEQPSPDDRLLVLNRGFAVYTETGLFPPAPYFHATHILGVFPTPSPDPLGEALSANPRFIVIADPATWHITESVSRYRQALAYVAAHYRPLTEIAGDKDSFTIYELAR